MDNINEIRFIHGSRFHNACAMNDIEDLNNLLINYPNIINYNMRNNEGLTGFMLACKKNNYEILKILLNDTNIDIYAEVNTNIYDEINGYNCFHIACKYGSIDCIKILINSNKFDINKTVKNINGFTIACLNNQFKLVEELSTVNNLILQGPVISLSSLHSMIIHNRYAMVKKLLSLPNIDPFLKDEYNKSPSELIEYMTDEINKLFVNLNKIKQSKLKNSELECLICYDKIIKGTILYCHDKHVFCDNCLDTWKKSNYNINNSCPVCRAII